MFKKIFSKVALFLFSPVFFFYTNATAQDHFLSGMASLSCSGAMIKLGNHPGQIYLLTNGHCWKKLLTEANATHNGEIVHSQIPMKPLWQVQVHGNRGQGQFLPFSEMTYATMTETDIALFKTAETETELIQRGIKIFTLEEKGAQINEAVRITSGYWQETQTCFVDQHTSILREFIWTWKNGFSLTPDCKIKGGWSGSPVLSRSGKIIGILNTANEKGLDNCSLSNPCEVNPDGTTRHKAKIAYAQRTQEILGCIHENGDFDLNLPTCQLPKPLQPQFLDWADASTLTAESFQNALNRTNLKVAPMVKQIYGKYFLATGNWPKEYSKTSSGGSFYHPKIPGVATPDSWGVHIVGWLAREPGFTPDAMEFTLCHELGHHIHGGADENNADHFAPTCLRWVWTDSENIEWYQVHGKSVKPEIQGQCQKADSRELMAFCLRAFSAFKPIENLRSKVWKEAGLSQAEISKTHLERRKEVMESILHKNP